MKKLLVLASTSPRRKMLLEQMGLKFEAYNANVSEKIVDYGNSTEVAVHNAVLKAKAVAITFPNAYVLGADTIVTFGDRIFNKPTDLSAAKKMLAFLGGKTHSVITGLALQCTGENFSIHFHAETRVSFRPLSKSTIEGYLGRINPLDKSGGYAIQEACTQNLVEKIEGSLTNVIGLPTEALTECLKQHGLFECFQ